MEICLWESASFVGICITKRYCWARCIVVRTGVQTSPMLTRTAPVQQKAFTVLLEDLAQCTSESRYHKWIKTPRFSTFLVFLHLANVLTNLQISMLHLVFSYPLNYSYSYYISVPDTSLWQIMLQKPISIQSLKDYSKVDIITKVFNVLADFGV